MRIAVNWFPSSPTASAEFAEAVERAGFWGLGITDSPRADELYSTLALVQSVTRRIAVGPCVTNPVTRHVAVHRAAFRQAAAHGLERCFLGVGSGDSGVRGLGLRPASPTELVRFADQVRDEVGSELQAFVAAAGPKATAAAGEVGALLAGCGRDLEALGRMGAVADAHARPGNREVQRWLSMRVAVARDDDEAQELRRSMLPRALSAARFNMNQFSGVPEDFAPVLRERFADYDYQHHARSGQHANARLLADRPDIEDWALDRYAIIGTVDAVSDRLAALADAGVHGVVLSPRFEDAMEQLERVATALRSAELVA